MILTNLLKMFINGTRELKSDHHLPNTF